MENNYYVRIQEQNFGFVVDGIHDIDESMDHAVTQEEYDMFFKLQSKGKQFRVKEAPTGENLFDLIEEYIPEPVELPVTVTLEERIEALESVMLEVLNV